MDLVLPDKLINILAVSMLFSIILMTAIQKLKTSSMLKEGWHIWVMNLLLAFAMGIPFAIQFYDLTLYDSIWVGVFTFIGAPAIYDALKAQNIINFTPQSLTDKKVSIDEEKIIR